LEIARTVKLPPLQNGAPNGERRAIGVLATAAQHTQCPFDCTIAEAFPELAESLSPTAETCTPLVENGGLALLKTLYKRRRFVYDSTWLP
jgi:hypothetical protein